MTPTHARRARRLLVVPFVLAAAACNITYDARAKEYRISLVGLSRSE